MITKLQKIKKNKILILGGGGIIGREAVIFFLKKNYKITVIDKKIRSLQKIQNKNKNQLHLIKQDIIFSNKNKKIFSQQNIIINCIGLNDHSLGVKKPELDVTINIIALLKVIKYFKNKEIIHIGTTHQYSGSINKIRKFGETLATDVQGISKNAIENYLIFYAKKYKFKLICLRIGNSFGCFDKNITNKKGLVYEIFYFLFKKKKITLYKKNVKKNFCYIPDIIKAIHFLIHKNTKSPKVYNFIQYNITIDNFVRKIIKIIKIGKVIYSKKKIHTSNFDFSKMYRGNFYKIFKKIKGENINNAIKKSLKLYKIT
jgi:nucleoside-diphosphate-sugar epimerase